MTILCYHAVQPNWTAPMCMDPPTFAAHGSWLAKRNVVPLQESVKLLDRRGRLPRGMLALTFDDGFSSLYDHALPVLSQHRLPATVFLVARTLTESGQGVDWVDRPPSAKLTTLDIDQIREMQSAGIRFESHSYAHADLTRMDFGECVRDLRESRELLASLLGEHVRFLAYPRGRHNEAVRKAAEQAGYTHAFALPEHREPDGRYSVPRVGIYHGNSVAHLRFKSARAYLGLRTGPGYHLQQRLHRVRGGARS